MLEKMTQTRHLSIDYKFTVWPLLWQFRKNCLCTLILDIFALFWYCLLQCMCSSFSNQIIYVVSHLNTIKSQMISLQNQCNIAWGIASARKNFSWRVNIARWVSDAFFFLPATVYGAQFSTEISSSNHLVRQVLMCCWVEALVILFCIHPLAEKQGGISWFPRSVAADANATSLVIRENAPCVLSPSLSHA